MGDNRYELITAEKNPRRPASRRGALKPPLRALWIAVGVVLLALGAYYAPAMLPVRNGGTAP